MTASPALPAWGFVLGSALLSAAVAGGWWRYARHRVLDLPDERRLHQVPTPRGGGLGIAVVLLAASFWLGQGGPAFALGLLVTAGAGLADLHADDAGCARRQCGGA